MLTDIVLSSVTLIKATPCTKILQRWHGHSGFQDLILFLKPLTDVAVLIFTGIVFQIMGQVGVRTEYLIYFCFSNILYPFLLYKRRKVSKIIGWFWVMAIWKFRPNINWENNIHTPNLNVTPSL